MKQFFKMMFASAMGVLVAEKDTLTGSIDIFGVFPNMTGLFEKLEDIKLSVVKNVLGEEYGYYKRINVIKSASGLQARLPYDMNPL